ncbi:CK5P3 protein, partial [Piprites chloris]|nr:CK5P3 protein [Piprites chloris]
DNVRQELLALVQDLPSLLSRVGAAVGALGEAIELYQACVGFVCDWGTDLRDKPSGTGGQTSWGQTLKDRPPPQGQSDKTPGGQILGDQPLWGQTLRGTRTGGQTSGDKPLVGDRGTDPEGTGTGGQTPKGSSSSVGIPSQLPPLSPPVPEEGVARGSDALTVLENPETRNQFIDELMELELFLAQRLAEMEEEADIVAMSQLQLAPALLQGQTSAHVGALLGTARALLAQLCSRSVQHLCMILASPRY